MRSVATGQSKSLMLRRLRTFAAPAVAGVLLLSACSATSGTGSTATPPARSSNSASPPPSATDTPTTAAPNAAPVHVSLLEGDGGVYGVGMPIVAYFDRAVTDATAFAKASKVTVNGLPAAGAWYWQKSGRKGKVLEAHYRPPQYWPANAKIFLDLPVKGLSAGAGLAYDDSLTLSIATGPAHVSTVDCAAEKMTVTANGTPVRTMPVSCGKAKTPTFSGTKVVMQKGEQLPGSAKLRPSGTVRMVSNNPADPYDLMVPWSVRITNSGEYVHAASWNGGNIGIRSTSNGCTNLNVNDAAWFFRFAQIGDVVTYAHTGGTPMPAWDGYGDWNVPWGAWSAGGLVPSSGR